MLGDDTRKKTKLKKKTFLFDKTFIIYVKGQSVINDLGYDSFLIFGGN